MLEMAASGAQVMHGRAVDIADRFDVDIRVLSSFVDDEGAAPRRGTLITKRKRKMEDLVLTGVALKAEQAKLVLRGLAPGMRTQTVLLEALANAGVSVDMVNESFEGEETAARAEGVLRAELETLGGGHLAVHTGLSRIALVGNGMEGRPGVYARAYRALLDAGVEVQGVSTSTISITVLVQTPQETEAVQALHAAFRLDRDPAAEDVAERDLQY
jgi:aspartate kinase